MKKEPLLRVKDLVENPTTRLPVCLCLDVSNSMEGDPVNELNEGVGLFFYELKKDEIAFYSAEVAVVTFGGFDAECLLDFANLERVPKPPKLEAVGMTPMGEGVNLALDLLEKRLNEYREKGVDYFQPWLVLMSDGSPNGDETELERAIQRVSELEHSKKLTVITIGIGKDADMEVLAKFSSDKSPLKLKGLKFKDFFSWLSRSVSAISQSMAGENVELEPTSDWGSLD